MSNLLTALAMIGPFNETGTMTHCNRAAFDNRKGPAIPIAESGFCPYIDLNQVENIDGDGYNYFRSSNPYELESWALFGEADRKSVVKGKSVSVRVETGGRRIINKNK